MNSGAKGRILEVTLLPPTHTPGNNSQTLDVGKQTC